LDAYFLPDRQLSQIFLQTQLLRVLQRTTAPQMWLKQILELELYAYLAQKFPTKKNIFNVVIKINMFAPKAEISSVFLKNMLFINRETTMLKRRISKLSSTGSARNIEFASCSPPSARP